MKIQYLGHSCFRLISELNTAIICDPYQSEMVGFAMPKVSCDVVTISHHHRDHDCIEEVWGNPAVLEGEVCLAADDVAVQSLNTFHDDQKGKLRGENTVFCFLIDGLKVVHMGDVGFFDKDLAAQIYNCDVLLLPVGGTFTVNAYGANEYVKAVNPRIVVPMHYKTERHAFDIDGVEKFLALQNPENVRIAQSETLTLWDAPQNEQPQIVVLQPYTE